MPFQGNGVFKRIANWTLNAAQNINILPDLMDADTNDIASGLSLCLVRDGQAPMLANLPMGGFQINNLGAPTNPGDATPMSWVQTYTNGLFAPLNSPNLTGIPTAPTAAVGTNTDQIATMAALLAQAMTANLPGQSAGTADMFPLSQGASGVVGWSGNLKTSVIRWVDGADITKKVAFDLSGLTTATTRTIAIPDKSGTMAMIGDVPAVLLAVLSPSGSATADFLNIFTSAYDSYLVTLNGVTNSPGNLTLNLQFAVAGVVNTGSNYVSLNNSASSTATTAFATTGFGFNAAGEIRIKNANSTLPKHVTCEMTMFQSGTTYSGQTSQCVFTPASIVSGIRLSWSGGNNFTGGTIRIYGLKNS